MPCFLRLLVGTSNAITTRLVSRSCDSKSADKLQTYQIRLLNFLELPGVDARRARGCNKARLEVLRQQISRQVTNISNKTA